MAKSSIRNYAKYALGPDYRGLAWHEAGGNKKGTGKRNPVPTAGPNTGLWGPGGVNPGSGQASPVFTPRNPNPPPPPVPKPPTAAPTPTVTPVPKPAPLPQFDALYDTTVNRLAGNRQNVEDAYRFQGQQLSQAYGFDEQGREITDPSQALYNPFNRMALLRKAFQEGNNATTGTLAGQGQLYSGYHQEKLDDNRHGFNVSEDDLRRGYTTDRRGLLDSYLSALDAIRREEEAAEAARLQRDIDDRENSDPDDDDDGDGGGGGGPAPSGSSEYQPGSGRPKSAPASYGPTIKGTDIPLSTLPKTQDPFKGKKKKKGKGKN